MAQVKAHEVDAYLKKPNPAHSVILIYGPDTGSVSERATILAKNCGADLTDPFATIKLDADDAASDPARIADEAHTVSMFGGKRLIWIRGSTQKNLPNAIQPVLDTPPEDALIIIEAGDLKKSVPLRTRIEKAKSAVALPCYVDQVRALDVIIDEEIRKAGLTIDPDARELLKGLIGGDRLASRGEVQKLCLYAADNGKISVEDINAIVGDASALAIDTLVDAASCGNIAAMEKTYKKLLARGTSVVQVVGAMQRHFQMLHQTRSMMESNNLTPQAVINTIRPPLNFQRKPLVSQALGLWRLSSLTRALSRLEKLSLDARANAALSSALVGTALLAISVEAKRGRR